MSKVTLSRSLLTLFTSLERAQSIEGDLIEMSTKPAGLSGPRVTEIWEEVRKEMETKAKSFTLDTFVAKENERMYYI